MGIIARQFGRPTGLAGRVVGRLMARGNGDFNRWLAQQCAAAVPAARSVVELGCGPGVGLRSLLAALPEAHVIGVDLTPTLRGQAERRNRDAITQGRLRLVTGDSGALAADAPFDLVVAVHVLYFWHQPDRDLKQVADLVGSAGRVALGYQLRGDMPKPSQREFPTEGHRLYDSDDEVSAVLAAAGLATDDVRIFGDPTKPAGRVLFASPS